MSDEEAGGAAAANSMMMVPWFLGGPWVPKYGGKGSPLPFSEWRSQMEVYLRAQTLTAAQRVDFVMSALQGEAKREMLLLISTDRETDAQIFMALEKLYGENVSISQLRSHFFKCQQQTGEGVGPFILRLRESHSRWRSKEAATGSDDEMLRSQLVLGLLPGPVQTELQRRVRREMALTFEGACGEAKAMEKETERAAIESIDTRRTYNTPPQPNLPSTSNPLHDWSKMKEALRAELAEELRAQVTDLKTSLLAEMRSHRATQRQPDQPLGGEQGANRIQRRARQPQWDDQGRPICLRCGKAGHMQRDCQPMEMTNTRRVADEGGPVTVPMRAALVGESPEVEVLVQGRRVPCILDTGSQVTLFSQGLFQSHLQDTELKEGSCGGLGPGVCCLPKD
ncbi:uncharacterized protein LOC121719808 [Alosa sapidissima]|uniref:uncharacterized protein LOC121719808 n=1 Tax=Alosa sapidissima TaxID=34773 RepID=UPI001C08A07F|nr:uncharacterized protein LOC121719808 [Alosa sapidissima]